MNTTTAVTCPTNKLPARVYCRKGPAIYYIEPSSGTIFQAEMPSVGAMNAYADHEYASGVYSEYAKSRDLKIATARPRLAAIKQLAEGKRLLDVGCATGFFLEAATEEGFDVRGVEFSTVAIGLSRPDIRERIVRGDVNALRAQERFAANNQQESEWRAWLIAGLASHRLNNLDAARQQLSNARNLLNGLEKRWGTDHFKTYLARPDVQFYRRQLDKAFLTKQ